MSYDFIIVGAGITGITLAEQLASKLDKKILLIEKRNHIGGLCYDFKNDDGILIHKYGPHTFHTDSTEVYRYLSSFTNWNMYSHKVVGNIDGTLVPLPFNLISIDKCLPEDADNIKSVLIDKYNVNDKISIFELLDSDDPYLKKLGQYVYENVYLHYNEKQWNCKPEDIDKSIIDRLPIQVSYDCRYHTSIYQGIPSKGYTHMFEKMLLSPNIDLLLETDYNNLIDIDYENKEIYYKKELFKGELIFTGMIDEFFNYKYGHLPYRSTVTINETMDKSYFQQNATINYPNDYHFTRITEYKYITGQQIDKTTIQFEYPSEFNPNFEERNMPSYPIINKENVKLYEKYKKLGDEYKNIIFIGRCAEYKYLDMDMAVYNSLKLVNKRHILK